MIKRKIVLLTACCALLLSCGWLVFRPGTSESAAPASANGEAHGSFVALRDGGKTLVLRGDGGDTCYTVASSVWVYRDNKKAKVDALQPGDDVQIIFNASKEVAYIKVTVAQAQTPATEPTAASPSPSAEAAPQPSMAPAEEPQPTVQPSLEPKPQPTAKPAQREDWKQMNKVKKQKHQEDEEHDHDGHDDDRHDGEPHDGRGD